MCTLGGRNKRMTVGGLFFNRDLPVQDDEPHTHAHKTHTERGFKVQGRGSLYLKSWGKRNFCDSIQLKGAIGNIKMKFVLGVHFVLNPVCSTKCGH